MSKKELIDIGTALILTAIHISLVILTWWLLVTKLFHEDFEHYLFVASLGLWITYVYKFYLGKVKNNNKEF